MAEAVFDFFTDLLLVLCIQSVIGCKPTVTIASGTHAPDSICSGDLIFSDEFSTFDLDVWQHQITGKKNANGEFQLYVNDRNVSFVENNILHIRPTPISENEPPRDEDYIHPVKSARIFTQDSFRFCYGRIEIRAKNPIGDWLWPALWLIPSLQIYGTWPMSGEIDMMESRGNKALYYNFVPYGVQNVGATLHLGPNRTLELWRKTHWERFDWPGFYDDFHRYQLVWTPDGMTFSIDDDELGNVYPGEKGFYKDSGFEQYNVSNIWRNGTKMAPFDEQFHIIINLAVGGTTFFSDSYQNTPPKPWKNSDKEMASQKFWNARDEWLPTWNLQINDSASFKVDYVKVWAL